MSEGNNEVPETVWWINSHEPLRRSESIRKWLHQLRSHGGTYIPKEKIPFSTSIPVHEIDGLPDANLQEVLIRQHNNVVDNDRHLTVPVVKRTGELLLVWTIPRERRPAPAEAPQLADISEG